jgi:hypothetical protein
VQDLGTRRAGAAGIVASAQGEESWGGEIVAMSGGAAVWTPSLRPYRVVR